MRLDCTLELLKPASRQVRGFITVRLERRSSEALSHAVVREEISHLDQDVQDCLNGEGANDEDLVGTVAGLLDRMGPLVRVASMVWRHYYLINH